MLILEHGDIIHLNTSGRVFQRRTIKSGIILDRALYEEFKFVLEKLAEIEEITQQTGEET